MNSQLLVFAKAPIPGVVKTRLFACLSEEQATALHCRMLAHTLDAVTASGLDAALYASEAHPFLQRLCIERNLSQCLQQGRHLGERMFNAAHSAMGRLSSEAGRAAVIIIGSDCPDMSAEYIRQAEQVLRHRDVVLGPAADGGYVLIGFAESVAERLFSDIPWGSDSVYLETQRRIEQLGLSWEALSTLQDVDRPADLLTLKERHPSLLGDLLDVVPVDQGP